ncbi:MAG: heptaprenyl diphosphate synthase component 2 [Chloroflexota bacterium]|jgi:geranylgeranyl pyrophosphate synthase|nr:heptaprenyl diphosphate synthase component 2 [Chloroflexota bacterium]
MTESLPPVFHSIEEDLAAVERRLAKASALPNPLLRSILEGVLLAPGKRMRPALTIASGRLFHDSTPSMYAMASAVEFLHTATLIHDDVVDQTDARRGEPTLYSVIGNSVAILVGDYLYAQAAAAATETNNLRVMHLFAESVMTVCAGQIDESTRDGDGMCWIDRETYYRTIDAKTAALFVLSCETGAILGEAPVEATDAVRRYARSLGMAFQVVDDILDLIGDEDEMGKPAGSDLRQGVVTLPLIYLREELPDQLFRAAFSSNGDRDDAIATIASCAGSSRAIDRSYDEARQLVADAVRALDAVPRGAYRDLLVELGDSVVERRS